MMLFWPLTLAIDALPFFSLAPGDLLRSVGGVVLPEWSGFIL